MGGGKLKPSEPAQDSEQCPGLGVEGRRLLQKLPDVGTLGHGKHMGFNLCYVGNA